MGFNGRIGCDVTGGRAGWQDKADSLTPVLQGPTQALSWFMVRLRRTHTRTHARARARSLSHPPPCARGLAPARALDLAPRALRTAAQHSTREERGVKGERGERGERARVRLGGCWAGLRGAAAAASQTRSQGWPAPGCGPRSAVAAALRSQGKMPQVLVCTCVYVCARVCTCVHVCVAYGT